MLQAYERVSRIGSGQNGVLAFYTSGLGHWGYYLARVDFQNNGIQAFNHGSSAGASYLKITLKQRGLSTMGGRKVWFDRDILRLNYDEKGVFLGEFQPEDKLLVVNKKGEYYTTTFDELFNC